MSQFSCIGGHEPLKTSSELNTVCYSPQKRPEMTKLTSFDDVPISMYRGSRAVEIVPGAKKRCALAHENGRKLSNRRVLTMSQFSCTGGHEPLKMSPERKKCVL